MIQRFHAGYSAHFQHLNITLTVDGQPGIMSGTISDKGETTSYHYFSFLPVAQFSWAFTRSRTLSFQYNGNTELPSLQQLQPITNLTNPQYPVIGNPSLKPAFSQSLNLHYEQSSLKPTQFLGFGIELGYNTKQNPIITNIIHPKDTGSVIQQTTYINAGETSFYYASYHFNFPAIFHKHLRLVINGNTSHLQEFAMTDNILYSTICRNWSQGLHVQYILPTIIETEFSSNYNITNTHYSSGGNQPASFSSVEWALNNLHYFGHRWILSYNISQVFISGNSQRLQANTALLRSSLQRLFLKKNRATISITGYNLLNSTTGVSQSASPTSVTKNQTVLTGRYFIASFLWKWGKFSD
jgi:hypothetical protein